VGLFLTADTAGLNGGGAISYQWERGDSPNGNFANIEGANDQTYRLTTADLNKYVRVRVSCVNNTGTVNSSPTAVVVLQLPRITIDFNYGAISIRGNNGNNIIYKTSARPNSLVLSATGYTNVEWHIDGDGYPATGDSITLDASDYSATVHSITFIGVRDGKRYSQSIPFTVKN
jgi:hypothetical protein